MQLALVKKRKENDQMNDMTRVVSTGMGAVTPLGNDVKTFWQHAVAGVSGAGAITRFDASQFRTRIACEVKGFTPEKYLDRNEIKRRDRKSTRLNSSH